MTTVLRADFGCHVDMLSHSLNGNTIGVIGGIQVRLCSCAQRNFVTENVFEICFNFVGAAAATVFSFMRSFAIVPPHQHSD